jgi:hypothetical protein
MHLEGSCHCKKVRFSLDSATPVPFMECYCSICRKTAGGGGFAINLGGDARTLKVEGKKHVRIYHARIERDGEVQRSDAERHFCGECGSALWLYDAQWPDLVHPLACAIDTPLPIPPGRVRLMLDFKPAWVVVPKDNQPGYPEYPPESLEDWHRRHNVFDPPDKS